MFSRRVLEAAEALASQPSIEGGSFPAQAPYCPDDAPDADFLERFFAKRNLAPAFLVDAMVSLLSRGAVGADAVDDDLAAVLGELARGAPYDVLEGGRYDEAEANGDVDRFGEFAAGASGRFHSIVPAYYSAPALLRLAGRPAPADVDRAARALELERPALAQARYLWALRLLEAPGVLDVYGADAALVATLHADRAEALLRLDRPGDAFLEAQAALALDPAHAKAQDRLRRAADLVEPEDGAI